MKGISGNITSKHSLSFLSLYVFGDVIGPALAIVFQSLHIIPHNIESFGTLLYLSLHIAPVPLLAPFRGWGSC
jgi:hypothetical protein